MLEIHDVKKNRESPASASGDKFPEVALALLRLFRVVLLAFFMAHRILLMEKDPGRVISELVVELPHPRQRKSAAFLEKVDRVYATLAG